MVTEVGATLRAYLVGGRPAILGFDEAQLASHARGPDPDALARPGRRRPVPLGGVDHQLPLDEPGLGNAIHGLVRWVNWVSEAHSDGRLVMRHRLHARVGYPFCLDLVVSFGLDGDGPGGDLGGDQRRRRAGALRRRGPSLPHGRMPVPSTAGCSGCPRRRCCTPTGGCCPAGRGAGAGYRARLPGGPPDRRDPARHRLHRPGARPGRLRPGQPGVPGGAEARPLGGPGLPLAPALQRGRAGGRRAAARAGRRADDLPPDALRSGEDVISLQPGETTTASWGIDVTGFRD